MADVSQVVSLVESVRQYKDFRQMAMYNVQCILSHTTPPHVGWRENVQAVVESGGIDAVNQVLRKHNGSPDVQRCAIEALRMVTINPEYAGMVASSGALAAALDAICVKPSNATSANKFEQEDLATEAAALLKTVAHYNPDAILDAEGGLEAILRAMRESDNPTVLAACAEVLDRISRSERGEQEILRLGGIQSILQAMAPGKETTEEMLRPMFRLLERLAQKKSTVELIRKYGGVEAIVAQLEAHSDNEAILRVGGRLLGIVAAGDLDDAIARLKAGNISDKVREFTTALLSNLALQPENIDKIIQQGGIRALINNFDQFNPRTQEAAARALGRLANNRKNIREIINAGGVEVLVSAINKNKNNPDVLYAATHALNKIASSSLENAMYVEKAKGIKAIMATLAAHPEYEAVTLEALKMLGGLAAVGYDMSQFADSSSIKAIIAGMKQNILNADIQLAGNRALAAILDSKDKKAASTMLSCGAVPVITAAMETHRNHKHVVGSALQVLVKLVTAETKAATKAINANIGAVISAVFAQTVLKNHLVDEPTQALFAHLVSEKTAVGYIAEIVKQTNTLCAKQSESAAVALDSALMAAAVVAKLPALASAMMNANAASEIISALHKIVKASDIPDQFTLIPVFAQAIISFVTKTNRKYLKTFVSNGAITGLLESIRKHAKQPQPLVRCLEALQIFAAAPESKRKVVDEGGIEACVGGIRANSEDPHVVHAAVDVLIQLASYDDVAAMVCFKGGTRQIIKSMTDNCTSAAFERPIERCLLLLERVASVNTNDQSASTRVTLIKQGAVEAVTKVMEAYSESESIEAIGARVLSRLLDRDGVIALCDKLLQLSEKLVSTKNPKVLPDLARTMTTVGYLALSHENVPIIREKMVAPAILSSLQVMRKMEATKDREQAMRAGLRSIGRIWSTCPMDESLGLVDFIIKVLKDKELTTREKIGALDCVKLIAGHETTAKALIQGNAVDIILKLVKKNPHDEQLATAAFGALATLAEHEIGVHTISKAGGTTLALSWLRDNSETSSPRLAEECMSLIGNLALLDSNIPEIVKSGIIDTVITVLEVHCSDPSNPQPRLLNAAVSLLGRIAIDESIIRDIVRKGAVARVIDICNSSTAYLSDAECMEAVIFLIESCALVDDLRQQLVRDGAIDMIMAAMSANANNEDVVVTGSRALQALLGQSPETVQAMIDDINKRIKRLEKDPTNVENQDKLLDSLQTLSNLALVEGLLNESNAVELSKVLCHAINVINDSVPDGAKKKLLLTTAIQALSRVQMVAGGSDDMDTKLAVKTVLAVLKSNPDDDTLQESGLFALGTLASNAKAVRIINHYGGVKLVEKTIKEAAGRERVRDAALKTLDKLRGTTVQKVQRLASTPEGVETIAAVIAAHSYDTGKMRACIDEIARQKGGLQALLSVLGSKVAAENPEMQMELIDVLKAQCKKQGLTLDISSPEQMEGILNVLSSDAGSSKEQLERQLKTLELMSHLGPESAQMFVDQGGVEKILKLMEKRQDDPTTVLGCLSVLNNMASSNNKELVKRLVAADGATKITDAMKRHPNSEPIAKEAIELLQKMAFIRGIDNVGMDAETMRLLARTVDKFAANVEIQNAGSALVEGLSEIYQEEGANMIAARLDAAMLKTKLADDIVECYDDKGRVYYFNRATGETSWEKPAEYAAMMRAMEGVAKLTEAHKDNISAVNPDTLKSAMKQMKKHANEPARLTALAKALATLATNDENRAAIANAGGLQAIIQALNGEHVDPEFLLAAISLLNQFARNDYFKDQICEMGGVNALIRILVRFVDNVEVVEKCLSALANLAFNSPKNMKQIMKCKGVDAVEKVMQRHPDQSRVLQLVMVLLSNLMYGNDENKLIIGKKCGDEIVNVIRVFFRDVKLFKSAMRALGNLSYCDQNIRWIVENGATKCIVAGMVANQDNIEAQQIAIDVIGNFASLQEDNVRDKIAKGELQSVYEVIVIEGGAARILKTVQETEEAQLLMSGMDALSNLANDPSVTEKLIKMGIVPVVVDAMQKYDWDEELMDKTVRLMAILTYSKSGVDAFGKRDGVQVLLSAMETHADQAEFLTSAAAALKNIASKESLREQIGELGGVEATLSLVERNLESKPFILEILALYIRLTRTEELSEKIAQKGMHVILKTINVHEHDAKFLTSAFTLLGHLAFAPKNLKIIVQYGGIGLIINSICEHPDSKELMTRSIQTLDNIAMASPEHAKIVIREGGDVTIKEVISAYKDDPTVVQYGKSALLSMTALEKRPARKQNRIQYQGTDNAKVGKNVDPLAKHRNMLQAGALLIEWSGGGPHTRHVFVSSDWRHITWKDPKKNIKSANMINLRDVRSIKYGSSPGHKKGRKQAVSKCAFSIVGRATNIDLEAKTAEDAQRWVEALKTLLNTHKRDPRWLK